MGVLIWQSRWIWGLPEPRQPVQEGGTSEKAKPEKEIKEGKATGGDRRQKPGR